MNRAYQRATNRMVDGALTMQQIDKQRELDRYLARQQKPKTPVNEAQTDSGGFYEYLNRRKSKGHDAQTSQPFKH